MITIKELIWINHEGYKIIERELGKDFGGKSVTRKHEILCFEKFGENYNLIRDSKKLDTYDGLSNDYKYDLKILQNGGGTTMTASGYEAYKYIVDNIDENWSKSPYSRSYYDSQNIGWGYKPEGSIRVSDHWNFGEDCEHCPTAEPVDGWAVCRYENGIYHLIQKF